MAKIKNNLIVMGHCECELLVDHISPIWQIPSNYRELQRIKERPAEKFSKLNYKLAYKNLRLCLF